MLSLESLITRIVTAYVFTVPSAAVIVIVTWLSPSTNPDFPEITRVASGSFADASTATEAVRAGTTTTAPAATDVPLTFIDFKLASEEGGVTYRFTELVLVVVPSAATTVTVNALSPLTKLLPPETVTLANGSLAVAFTDTALVPRLKVTLVPEVTSEPLTWNDFKLASFEAGTMTVYLNSVELPFSAVTKTETVFEPTRRALDPETTALAFESFVTATTATEVATGLVVKEPLEGATPSKVMLFNVLSDERTRTFKVTV